MHTKSEMTVHLLVFICRCPLFSCRRSLTYCVCYTVYALLNYNSQSIKCILKDSEATLPLQTTKPHLLTESHMLFYFPFFPWYIVDVQQCVAPNLYPVGELNINLFFIIAFI